MTIVPLLSALSCAIAVTAAAQTSASLKNLNLLIGTRRGGNVFAGATLPYGMAKASPDVSGQNTGGFSTDNSNVTGFSHMHDSGTGGNPSLGNFPLFPLLCPENVIDNCVWTKYQRAVNYDNSSVKAEPGYFSLSLKNGMSAEMTVTEHAALYHFKFPSVSSSNGTLSPIMLLDLTDLSDSRQNATVQVSAETGRITANGTFLPSFGSGQYMSYVCADFQGAAMQNTGVYVNSRAGYQPKELFVTRGINLFYLQAGAFTQFSYPANGTITARVGVSLVSTEQACQNAEREMPTWDFELYRKQARGAWLEKLSPITIDATGVNHSLQTNFFSGIYRTMMSPQNYTGENPLWQSTEPYFDSYYCIWDMFRAQLPFLTILDPLALSQMVRSLLDIYVHLGYLPDCRMSLSKGFTQGGSNADIVLADAYEKSLPGIDYNLAYAAARHDAEAEAFDWSVEGRGGLQSWHALGYIPYLDYDYLGFGTNSRSISRTLEYSYDDFCVATLGRALAGNGSTVNGSDAGYMTYYGRAGNWRNLFKADQTSSIKGVNTGFTGFFQPKYLNGTWGYQDPILCSPIDSFCSLTDNPQETFEDSIWEYQFFVPHDMAALIQLLGGPDTFVRRLDYLHNSTIGLTDIGNEPSFLTVFQYHYAGRPGLSAKRVHAYVPGSFRPRPGGLPGNDDSGAMGSFTAWAMMGLFPNPGQNVYLITPPFFKSVSIRSLLTNKTATVTNVNFDPAYRAIYVQSATLNGKPYKRSWIGHDFFLDGGELVLTLGTSESTWGQGATDLPPSQSTSSGMEMGMGS